MSSQQRNPIQPTFPSARFRNFSMNSSSKFGTKATGIRTPGYARLVQKTYPNGISLYDKTFGMPYSPTKNTNRIAKTKSNRRRSLEVSKFSYIDQREQYRRLIEQYRTTSLKETSVIFGLTKNHESKKLKASEESNSVIDLTDKSPPNLRKTSQIGDGPSLKKRYERKTLKQLDNIEQKATSDETSELQFTTNDIKENGSCSKAKNIREEVHEKKTIKDLNFSSPYLSKNFVPDLIKTHNRRERQRKIEVCNAETRARLLREKREAKESMLAEILHKKLHLQSEKEEEERLVELTPEMNEVINQALVPYPPQEVLCQQFNISITREHISTLFGLNWLNDEIINFYMELIVQRSKDQEDLPSVHAMNTFFYPRLSTQSYNSVRRWTKRVDIFSKDIILFPIHLGVHWCLAVADFTKKEIRYYDSMGGSNRDCLETLKQYLCSEHQNKKGSEYNVSDWQLLSMSSIPQQMNGSDCGVFACKFAEYVTAKAQISFSQSNMAYFRRAMVWEILNKELLR